MCPTGPQDILDNGRTGFLVPMGDENTFAEKVCTLIENDILRKTMGEMASEESKEYSAENIVQRWMALFRNLIKQKHESRL